MKYENINKLLNRQNVSNGISDFGYSYFKIKKASKFNFSLLYDLNLYENFDLIKIKLQKGIFRTNCIDCLDRTNIIQNVFGRINIHIVFQNLKISNSETDFSNPLLPFEDNFENIFRTLWTENGNFLSKSYSGTNALKSDFTLTGKRTIKGAFQDIFSTLKRFYINNFRDGYNQDSHDLFIGNINAKKEQLKQHSKYSFLIFGSYVFLISCISYFIANTLVLREKNDKENHCNLKTYLYKFFLFGGIIFFNTKISLKYLKKRIIDLPTIDN